MDTCSNFQIACNQICDPDLFGCAQQINWFGLNDINSLGIVGSYDCGPMGLANGTIINPTVAPGLFRLDPRVPQVDTIQNTNNILCSRNSAIGSVDIDPGTSYLFSVFSTSNIFTQPNQVTDDFFVLLT